MSIIVKGMDMPKCCYDCQLAYDCMQCIVTRTSFIWTGEFRTTRKNFNPETDRLPDCPLVEVPTPHGDLIDKAKLKESVLKWLPPDPCGIEEKEYPYETDICVSMVLEIEEQPTVIESEE